MDTVAGHRVDLRTYLAALATRGPAAPSRTHRAIGRMESRLSVDSTRHYLADLLRDSFSASQALKHPIASAPNRTLQLGRHIAGAEESRVGLTRSPVTAGVTHFFMQLVASWAKRLFAHRSSQYRHELPHVSCAICVVVATAAESFLLEAAETCGVAEDGVCPSIMSAGNRLSIDHELSRPKKL